MAFKRQSEALKNITQFAFHFLSYGILSLENKKIGTTAVIRVVENPSCTQHQQKSLNVSKKRKILFLIWWDINGIQHYWVLKPGETVTTDHYSRHFRSFRAANEEKFNYKTNWKSHTALLQTSPIHSENYKESWNFFPHVTDLTDLAPWEYH